MAEMTQLLFSHKEVVTALVKEQGLHEGIWMLAVQFGMGASNVGQLDDGSDINPAAIIPLLKIGINRTDKLTNLSVDAAVVNPG